MTRALTGKRIVNTRAEHQAKTLDDVLQLHGAISLAYPCIEIIPAENLSYLDTALLDLASGHYDWLILTSANTVFALAERLSTLGIVLKPSAFRSAAIGATTAAIAKQLLHLDSVELPADYAAEALAESVSGIAGARLLVPQSNIARSTLVDMLTFRGAQVSAVTAYQTIGGSGGIDIASLLAHQQVDAITFTSSSTVTYFVERVCREGGNWDDVSAVCAACIGSKTAATARIAGFKLVEVASEHTLEGLIKALACHFAHATKRGSDS